MPRALSWTARAAAALLALLVAAACGLLVLALVAVGLVVRFERLHRIPITPGPPTLVTGTYEVWLEHDGRERRYLVHVPPNLSGEPRPLLLLLHGAGGTAETIERGVGVSALADREGFIVVFPEAVDRFWRIKVGADQAIDDLGYIRRVVEDVSARLPVDAARVYVGGVSNGAAMTTRLACEASDVFAAVAIVSGTSRPGFEEKCKPRRPVPMIVFLNTDDPLVRFDGRPFTLLPSLIEVSTVGAEEFLRFWAQTNGCIAAPSYRSLPDLNPRDDSTVDLRQYEGCDGGADIDFYELRGSGHTWPGGRQYLPPWIVGTTNRDIDARELIWQFVRRHTLS